MFEDEFRIFERDREYTIVSRKREERPISSLFAADNSLYVGREDGVLECYQGHYGYSQLCFQPEINTLENEVIQEKITAIMTVPTGGPSERIFAANSRDIRILDSRNGERADIVHSVTNQHAYVINSLSLNHCSTQMITSDFLVINLWCPERMENYFNLLNVKPTLSSGAVYVINKAKFSPSSDGLVVYSTSNGQLIFRDLNISPKGQEVHRLEHTHVMGIRSVSDFDFCGCNLIATRSLNNISVFDLRNAGKPLISRTLIESINDKTRLNASKAIYQTFDIVVRRGRAITGSYFGSLYDLELSTNSMTEVRVSDSPRFDILRYPNPVVATEDGFACAYGKSCIVFA